MRQGGIKHEIITNSFFHLASSPSPTLLYCSYLIIFVDRNKYYTLTIYSEIFCHCTHLHCSQSMNIILCSVFFHSVYILLLPESTILNGFIVKLCYTILLM